MESQLRANMRRMTIARLVDALELYPAPRKIDHLIVQMCSTLRDMLSVWPSGEELESSDMKNLHGNTQHLANLLERKNRPQKEGETDGLVLVLADALLVLAQQWDELICAQTKPVDTKPETVITKRPHTSFPMVPPVKKSKPESMMDAMMRTLNEPIPECTPIRQILPGDIQPKPLFGGICSNIVEGKPSTSVTVKEEQSDEIEWYCTNNNDDDDELTNDGMAQDESEYQDEEYFSDVDSRNEANRIERALTQRRNRARSSFDFFAYEMYNEKTHPNMDHRERRNTARTAFSLLIDKSRWERMAEQHTPKTITQKSKTIRLTRPQRPIDCFLVSIKGELQREYPGKSFEERRKIGYQMWAEQKDRTQWEEMAKKDKEKLMQECPALYSTPRRTPFDFYEKERQKVYKLTHAGYSNKERRSLIYKEWANVKDRSKWQKLSDDWKSGILLNAMMSEEGKRKSSDDDEDN